MSLANAGAGWARLLLVGMYPELGVYGMPALVVSTVVLAVHGYPKLAHVLLDHSKFFSSLWLGSGFAFVWKLLEKSAQGKSSLLILVAAMGVVALLGVGGWEMVTDPELAGVTVWPAFFLVARAVMERAREKDRS